MIAVMHHNHGSNHGKHNIIFGEQQERNWAVQQKKAT